MLVKIKKHNKQYNCIYGLLKVLAQYNLIRDAPSVRVLPKGSFNSQALAEAIITLLMLWNES